MGSRNRHGTHVALRTGGAVIAGLAAVTATPGAAHAVPPGNDSFATPTVLSGAIGLLHGSSVDASKEAGEPDHAGVLGHKSVWYRWTAPNAGRVVVGTDVGDGPSFDTLLAVYTGDSVGALTAVASNDDVSPYWWASRASFQAVAGTTYRIAVDGVAGKSGTFPLAWAMRPANDNFADATRVTSTSGSTTSDTTLATREADEARGQRRSVWYRWTAPRTGAVAFSTAGSLFDTTLAVSTGGSLSTLRLLARNDDYRSYTSRVRLSVRQGRTYRIAVAGYGSESGPAVLRWRML